jgi:hypothetical protein
MGVGALWCAQCVWLGRGDARELKMMKFHAKSDGRQKQNMLRSDGAILRADPAHGVDGKTWGGAGSRDEKLLCISIIHLST